MRALSLTMSLLFVGVSAPATAQVYKYVQGDGTVVYTDKLSDLPPKKRAYYNRQEQEAKKRRAALVNMLGQEEVEKREAEAERRRIERADLAEAERKRRLEAIDAQLESIQKRSAEREELKKKWRERLIAARTKLQEKLQEFRDAKEKYKSLATKIDFSLLPGQREERDDLKAKLQTLEKEIDALVTEVYVTIPEEARKAGIPPGWLR